MNYLAALGNGLLGDDSIGPKLIELIDQGPTEGFQCLDLGGRAFDLLNYFVPETQKILILDAAKMGLAPGAFCLVGLDQVQIAAQPATSHQFGLSGMLEMARALGLPIPELNFLLVEPQSMAPGEALSVDLSQSLPQLLDLALQHFQTERPL